MKKLLWKLFFALIILPGIIAGSMYWLNRNGFFSVHQVEVTLVDVQPQSQFYVPLIQKLEGEMAVFKGQSLWSVRLTDVATMMQSQNWIEESSVSRSWPATIKVKIKPHDVKLLYLGKNGKYYPIIEDGSFLDGVDSRQAPDVMLLDGEIFSQRKELREKAVRLTKEIPTEGSFSRKTISEVHYDNKDGFWMTLIKSGVQVKMGEEQVALKSARVAQVVDYLESRQFDARVIDANLSKKVLVRLRKGP